MSLRQSLLLPLAALSLACPKPPPPSLPVETSESLPAVIPSVTSAPAVVPLPPVRDPVALPFPRWAPPEAPKPETDELIRIEDTRDHSSSLLASFVGDARPAVRARAMLSVARLRRASLAPQIRAGLSDADPAVRRAAAFAVSALGDDAPAELLTALVAQLSAETDPGARSEALLALGRAGKAEHASYLVGGLDRADAQVAAALGLGLLAQRNQALPALSDETLAEMLSSPEAEARYAATYLLMRAKRLHPGLVRAAPAEPDEDTQALMARALGAKDASPLGAEARAALSSLVAVPSWRVRVEVVRSLARVASSPEEGALSLDAVLAGEAAAIEGLTAAAPLHPAIAALESLEGVAKGAQEAGAPLPALPGLASLYAALDRKLPAVKGQPLAPGVEALHCRAAALLDVQAGKGPDKVSRCGQEGVWRRGLATLSVIQAGASADPKAAQKALAPLLKDKDARVRAAAVEALGAIPGPDAAKLLRGALADKDPAVSATAVDAITNRAKAKLPELDKEAVKPLLALLDRYTSPVDAEALIAVYNALSVLADPAAKELPGAVARGLADPNKAIVDAAASTQKALALPAFTGKVKPLPQSPKKGPTPGAPQPIPARGAQAVVRTTQGEFAFSLLVETAPLTCANFAALARAGYFDGILFHRVVQDFVAQGGDPRGDGWGGPGYAIRDENSPLPYLRGAVGMALSGPDTGGSQWFVMHSRQPHLDGRYPLFGQLTRGQEVVDALQVGDRILGVSIR